MASLKLGETVVDRMGRHRAATCSAKTAHDTGGQRAGLRGSNPGRTGGIIKSLGTVDQQLIPQHPGHLHRLLHQAIGAVAAADGGLVPLGQSICDTTGQRAGRGLTHEGVVKHQKVRTTVQDHILLKGTLWGIDVGQCGPARTGGSAQRDRDAGQTETMGQQFAGIEHFSPSRCKNSITDFRLSN